RPACASPVRRRPRPRSSEGCPPGRTGSFNVPASPGRKAPCSATAPVSGPASTQRGSDMRVDYSDRIPNNVNLADDARLRRALEAWQPKFLDWWRELGPSAFQTDDVYLRT